MAKKLLSENLIKEKLIVNLNLAKKYLRAVKYTYKGGRNTIRLVIDGAYNTAELCIKSLLLIKMGDIPQTHAGVVQKFGEYYVKTKILPKKVGRLSNRMLRYRNKARYDGKDEEVESLTIGKEAIEFAEEMLEYLRNEINLYQINQINQVKECKKI